MLTRKGLHEPVYGSLQKQSPSKVIKKLETAADIASSLPGRLDSLNVAALSHLNQGQKPLEFHPRLLSLKNIKTTIKDSIPTRDNQSNGSKMPRLTVTGAAGYVKSKSEDVARKHVGPLSQEIKNARNPYLNV